ncbi:DivIVA domain-containing protein [Senegalimassilia anaerobia]|uniref:DivIVA domain-containing protein n=1 Tax=Senegalimassilia anaerobia TaxID=1473216 RepID=UPI0023F524E1|nr:DivIVA domain-containing protein [Senegalimassilia anaerobia]
MAITSAEIHNQSFSIDRKGYDVDEVDVFLEHVADEIDGLNQQIASLQSQIGEDTFAGFDRPATFDDEAFDEPEPEHVAEQDGQPAGSIDPTILAEKDAAIAELEKQLESKKADGNAIAQALIIAQRSADEILANAKADAAATIKDAEDEADRILDKAENDRQKVIDAIHKLEDDREEAREDYRDLLNDFITDATRKLAEIGEKAPKAAGALASGQHGRYATHVDSEPVVKEAAATAPQAPLTVDGSDAYDDAPAIPAAVPAAAVTAASPAVTGSVAPVASSVEKDFSGFGDAADDFEIDDLD